MKNVMKKISALFISIMIVCSSALSVSASADTSFQLPNYPCSTQGIHACWVHAISSMFDYTTGSPHMTEQIIGAYVLSNNSSYTPGQGASLTESYNTICYLFNNNTPIMYTGGSLSSSKIILEISINHPAFIAGSLVNQSDYGHVVALMGFSKSIVSVTGIYYMDPLSGQIVYSNYSASNLQSNTFSDITGTYTFNWFGSVTLS